MKTTRNRWLSMALVAGLGIGASSVALAHVDVGVNIGVPGVAYAPEPVCEVPPPSAVVVVNPGWYGDRYYDGHRYWERREWEDRHREREWHEAHGWHNGWRGHEDRD